jgi:hypothetical protein
MIVCSAQSGEESEKYSLNLIAVSSIRTAVRVDETARRKEEKE